MNWTVKNEYNQFSSSENESKLQYFNAIEINSKTSESHTQSHKKKSTFLELFERRVDKILLENVTPSWNS